MLPILTPLSVLIGIILGSHLSVYQGLMPWIFAIMTLAGSLKLNFGQFIGVMTHPVPLIASLFVLHLAMPLIALATGHLLFPNDSFTVTGLILAAAIPTGITSTIWVAINKGNVALTLSIILVNTLLAPFIVPFTMQQLVGAQVAMNVSGMMQGLLVMIVLPTILGMILNQLSHGRAAEKLGPLLQPVSKLGLGVVVAISSAVAAPFLRNLDLQLLGLTVVVLGLSIAGYLTAWLMAILLRAEHADTVAMTLNGGMRNISSGVIVAAAFFPPPVTVPVVLCMLFQQSLASLFSYLLKRRYEQQQIANNKGLTSTM